MTLTILQIAGKPGLYKLISKGNRNFIVETLDETKKRFPTFPNDRIISLADVAIFTENDEVPLMNVLAIMRDKEQCKKCSICYRKSTSKELRNYFAEILPEYDRERVKDSDIRKLIQWYNILVSNNITDFEEQLKPTEGDNVNNRLDENAEQKEEEA